MLGLLHLDQKSGVGNAQAASSWMTKAARAGHAAAHFQLAVMYCTGYGVRLDLAEGVNWYEAAAEQGHTVAQYNLAVMLGRGQGREADVTKATEWFQRAAERGWRKRRLLWATR
ncbi:tetratricopeptide repeat protein [Bradyrhizobium sp. CCBAU 11357]|uniref:tetratricopeptide repeat protein n=1 Tax=Bradyrhizobium sp. CCBAU 11357 TaxID=1630808 RepID=UPI002304B9DD|nr:tetratricopeptide repeat protein [Bradyrhizobium sp. CCBAU 11357]